MSGRPVDLHMRLAALVELIRSVGQVRDFDDLRKFEITALQQTEGLSISLQEYLKDQDEENRKFSSLRGQIEKLSKDNQELSQKYKQCKFQILEMEEEVIRARGEVMKAQAQVTAKQAEMDHLKSQVSFLSADLREKQREMLFLVQMQERLQGSSPTPMSMESWKKQQQQQQQQQPSSPRSVGKNVGGVNVVISGNSAASSAANPSNAQSPRSIPASRMLTRKSSSQAVMLQTQDRDSILWADHVTHNHVLGDRFNNLYGPTIFSKERAHNIADLKSVEFDMFSVPEDDLLCYLEDMLQHAGCCQLLCIEETKLRSFLISVHRSYRTNPFHNFQHAFSVTQMLFHFLFGADVRRLFQELDVVLLLLSGLCHDLDHPGLNNLFQVKTRSNLAYIFQDESVLEAYHSSCTFFLLNSNETNILSGLDAPKAKAARSMIRECILSTDMSLHFKFLGQLTSLDSLNVSQEGNRQLIFNMLLKCADISNEVRPFGICRRWALNLYEEFTKQGDLERAKGLPVTPMMDRDLIVLTKMQTGFIEGMLLPAFRAVARHLPELSHCVERLEQNKKIWQTIEDTGADINSFQI